MEWWWHFPGDDKIPQIAARPSLGAHGPFETWHRAAGHAETSLLHDIALLRKALTKLRRMKPPAPEDRP
jgi:hypothetical protein